MSLAARSHESTLAVSGRGSYVQIDTSVVLAGPDRFRTLDMLIPEGGPDGIAACRARSTT
jgi:hypothetical protein